MENKQNPNENQLQIELTPEVAGGTYANLAVITHSHSEVVLDFIRVLPGMPKAPVKITYHSGSRACQASALCIAG